MGNAGSNPPRERLKSTSIDAGSSSPCKEGEAFVFDKKVEVTVNPRRTSLKDDDNSIEDEAPYYTKAAPITDLEFKGSQRPRSNTVSEGTKMSNDNLKVLPTVFKWEGGGKQVYISGTFTEWKTLPMVKSHGDFVTIIDLPEGEHQYKFYVDGEWRHDPGVKIIDNGMGSKNNLVSVKNSDFEVFQALAKDSESVHASVQRDYSQDIPQSKPWEKVPGPPILPPHLLQVILNKDTPLSIFEGSDRPPDGRTRWDPIIVPFLPFSVWNTKNGIKMRKASHTSKELFTTLDISALDISAHCSFCTILPTICP